MVDIHSHVLPDVDDGSQSIESSLNMLESLSQIGVTDVVLTPHYRGTFLKEKEEILNKFNEFKKQAEKIPVNLYIGQEIYATKDAMNRLYEGKLLTLNDTKYVLLEFSYCDYTDITEEVYVAKRKGFIPIVAHAERYEYLGLDDIFEIKSLGGLIQINASSLVKKISKTYFRRVLKLLDNDLVDFVAGDLHEFREHYLLQAKTLIEKKYGKQRTKRLFVENAYNIIKGQA